MGKNSRIIEENLFWDSGKMMEYRGQVSKQPVSP
jgi:hypothetical protein